MKCAYCGEEITRPSNMAFSVEAYQLTTPGKYEGLMFDSLACISDFAAEHGIKYHSISVPLKELAK
ncbi:MAG: hypothetical protein LKJ72_01315 [[Lactobacillus] timonensis]|jgi:hypothetical protein|uniref:hypothetical protein n=1 Tax=[Lactobacillus] timonensis TaxID=1970790 RepID=UPI0023543339|nr:hypothetical protein [[Lactobacillus] timonensis]MCI1925645.1 hypothetical protein [[Lactobacillus] timonensis]MCI1957006.1 hypothetical protein [[Lactobacillus] timonensis]MCI1970039.1 hypothetical protein [[Lactobacillus] timonensis]MCI2006196.1 hypothetical protein [[Lactobacillus] timonensis]